MVVMLGPPMVVMRADMVVMTADMVPPLAMVMMLNLNHIR